MVKQQTLEAKKASYEEELRQVEAERAEKQDTIDEMVADYRRSLEEDFNKEYDERENRLKGSIDAIDALLREEKEELE